MICSDLQCFAVLCNFKTCSVNLSFLNLKAECVLYVTGLCFPRNCVLPHFSVRNVVGQQIP
jgi:hypothetical protein